MKVILLLTIIFSIAYVSSAERVEKRNIPASEVPVIADTVPGATIDGSRAKANPGYVFARESRNSVAVIRVGGRGTARQQTGTLICVSADNSTCDAALLRNKTEAVCRDLERCHFEGIRGGVRAP